MKTSKPPTINPHKVARAYGNQELSNSTYANVTIDNSKYFFEYGSSQPHVQVYIDNDQEKALVTTCGKMIRVRK